jgi:hypothetical protein
MSNVNYRLAEHQVEMSCLGDDMDTLNCVRFETTVDDGSEASAYVIPRTKWEAAGKPETIYVTVTAVIPVSKTTEE